jgi:RHS repeat-associated protein
VNELYQRDLSVDSGGGTVDLAYDYAGNLLRQQLQAGGALRYTHDAWNRLVKVELEDAEEDLHPRAEYEYNPLNWRTVERTDTDTTDSTHAFDEMRVHLYDPSWRLLESRIDSDFDPEETSPDFEEHTQLVWGLRYIDDIVSTRRDFNPAEEDGAEVRMFHATDAQFSSVAVLLNNGSLLERVAYSPYGVARHQWPADASGDGAVNSADLSIVLSSYGSITSSTYRSEADFNRDGDVDAADLAAVLAYAAALPEGTLSSPGIANRTGYCGYRFAPETEMYLARNRWNSPPLGRWIERDPLGYVDGMGLYEYAKGIPSVFLDPFGLCCDDECAEGDSTTPEIVEVNLRHYMGFSKPSSIQAGVAAVREAQLIEAMWGTLDAARVHTAIRSAIKRFGSNHARLRIEARNILGQYFADYAAHKGVAEIGIDPDDAVAQILAFEQTLINLQGAAVWLKVRWKQCESRTCLLFFDQRRWIENEDWIVCPQEDKLGGGIDPNNWAAVGAAIRDCRSEFLTIWRSRVPLRRTPEKMVDEWNQSYRGTLKLCL